MEQWPWCCLGGCDGYRRRWREELQSERDESTRVVDVFSFMTFFLIPLHTFSCFLYIFLSFLISARFSSSSFFTFFHSFQIMFDFRF